MKTLDVTKYLVLGMLSMGLIACGMPSGSTDSSSSTGSGTGDSLKSGRNVPLDDGGVQGTVSGGSGTKNTDGGVQTALSAGDNQTEPALGDMSAEFADDNTITIRGSVTKAVDYVAFVVNGTDHFLVAVNPDLSFSVQIGVTEDDKKSMIVDFVVGDSVKTMVMLDSNIEFQTF